MLRKTFTLLTIDLSMFGEGAGASAPAAGAAGVPAAAAEAPAAAPEVRYGKQPEQTAGPQQTQNPTSETPPDKGKQFANLIRGEFKEQYAAETQKLINRRFRDTDAIIQAQQPVMDLLASRYGIEDGNAEKILNAVKADTAFWEEAAAQAGMTVEQYRHMRELEAQHRRDVEMRESQQAKFLAQRRYQKWQAEAEALKVKYPEFSLEEMQGNDLFTLMLKNGYPMEQAFRACSVDYFSSQAAATAAKTVTDNIRARGSRPAEAGANSTPAYQVKDDVSKLTDKDVLNVLAAISNGGRVSFG